MPVLIDSLALADHLELEAEEKLERAELRLLSYYFYFVGIHVAVMKSFAITLLSVYKL